MLCVFIKILLHGRAKKERVSNIALLMVIFKLHHGSEGVKKKLPGKVHVCGRSTKTEGVRRGGGYVCGVFVCVVGAY